MEQADGMYAAQSVLPCVHDPVVPLMQGTTATQRPASCSSALAVTTAPAPGIPCVAVAHVPDREPSYVLSEDILGYTRLYKTLHTNKEPRSHAASAVCLARASSHCPPPQLRVEQTHRLQSFVRHRLHRNTPAAAEGDTGAASAAATMPPLSVRSASTRDTYAQKLAHELDECEAQCRRLDDTALHNYHSLRVNKSSSRHDNTRTATSRRRVLSPREQAAAAEARVLGVVKNWVASEEATWRSSRRVPCSPASRRQDSRTGVAQGGAARYLFRQMERGRFRVEEQAALDHRHTSTQYAMNADQEVSASSVSPETSAPAPGHTLHAVTSATSSLLHERHGSDAEEQEEQRSSTADSARKDGGGTFLGRLGAEPISCYRPMYHLHTSAPPCQSRRRRRRRRRGVRATAGSGDTACSGVAAHNVGALRHGFDHQRYRAYAELQDFVDWRATCRAVVRRRVCGGAAGTTTPLLDLFARARRTDQGGLCVGRAAAFSSVWTAKACELAILTERRRLCDKMRAFVPDFDAAALSLEAMEQLRQDLIRYVMDKPVRHVRNALFTVREIMDFVVRRNQLYDTLAHLYRPQPSDVVDAMHSPAEAALVAYLFDSVFTDTP